MSGNRPWTARGNERGTSGTISGNCTFSVSGGVPLLSAAGHTKMPPCARILAATRPRAALRRPCEIDVRTARRGESDQWSDPRIAAQIDERFAGAALVDVCIKAPLSICRLRYSEIDAHRPRKNRHSDRDKHGRRYQQAKPGSGYQPLAIEQHLVTGSDDHRKP